MKKKLYFAHPINTYNTPLEEKLVKCIENIFPDWELENPNQERHQEGYARRKKEDGNGMLYFTEEVLPGCSGVVFMSFRDGKIPAGVAKEVKYYLEHHLPVWQFVDCGYVGSRYALLEEDILSVEETRARLRDSNGNMLPY